MTELPNIPGGVPPEQRLLSMKQVEVITNLSDRTVWSLVNSGEIPCVRIRRRVLIDRADLELWIESNKSGGNNK